MTEPVQPPVAPAAPRRARSAVLPWSLVAALTAIVLGLSYQLALREGELTALRGSARTTAAPATAAPSATPAASQDPAVTALLRSLPRRAADDATAQGRVDAPVVLIVWSDYRCPYCAKWANETLPALKPYVDSGSLRIEARDLVLFGEESRLAAVAARAAGKQGRFWEFHHALFAADPSDGSHPAITTEQVLAFARTAGVPNLERFSKDLTAKALLAAVTADTDEATKLGLTSTPFFVLNTTPINGAQPTQTFLAAIEANGGHK